MSYYLKNLHNSGLIIQKNNKDLVGINDKKSIIIGSNVEFSLKGKNYSIESDNFWGSRFRIVRDNNRVGTINFRGNTAIELIGKNDEIFLLKLKYVLPKRKKNTGRNMDMRNKRFDIYLKDKIRLLSFLPAPKKKSLSAWLTSSYWIDYKIKIYPSKFSLFPMDDLVTIIGYTIIQIHGRSE